MPDIFNIDAIRAELDAADLCEDEDGGGMVQSVYVGTVMSLTPSGKMYAPWATGNVTRDEAEADADWWEQAATEVAGLGAFVHCGTGDACDVFVTRPAA